MSMSELTPVELLRLHAQAIDELRRRDIVRTNNNPLGDYTEWLVAGEMSLQLESNSQAGHDAISNDGLRYQIKGRRVTATNRRRQLSAIRNYSGNEFDWLVAVIFGESYEVLNAYLIPHDVLGKYGKHREHVNALIVILSGAILDDPEVQDVTHRFRAP